jgi:hypothetical protein
MALIDEWDARFCFFSSAMISARMASSFGRDGGALSARRVSRLNQIGAADNADDGAVSDRPCDRHVRVGSISDLRRGPLNVRVARDSGRDADVPGGPSRAIRRHRAPGRVDCSATASGREAEWDSKPRLLELAAIMCGASRGFYVLLSGAEGRRLSPTA